MMQIQASTTVQGIHRWPEAPIHRMYLSEFHHHMFHITVWAEVTHTNRDIEFHDLKALVDQAVANCFPDVKLGIINFDTYSCEDIGKILLGEIPVINSVLVSEDGQFGATVYREDEEDASAKVEVVTICGSTKFKNEWEQAIAELEVQGKAVFSVGSFMHADNIEFDPETKERLDALHKAKIAMSDSIYVINVGGYIGESTRSEISLAESLGLRIEYLEEGRVNYANYGN